jgi:hypothetical protein
VQQVADQVAEGALQVVRTRPVDHVEVWTGV